MENQSALRAHAGPLREQEIYQLGMKGGKLSVPVRLAALEQKAKEVLSPPVWDYVAGGAGGEQTARANLEAFYRWRIVPRMLRDVAERDLSLELFGSRLSAPLLLGPVGTLGIVHKDSDVAVARAAASVGVPFVLSTASSRPLEEVAQASGENPRWFQLYWGRNPELTASLVGRAEKAGYQAVVVTLDTQVLGWRERDLDHGFLPFLQAQGVANYFSDPVFRAALEQPPEQDPAAAIRYWASIFSNLALSWADLPFLRQHTRLPILLKGILHAEDARRALDAGMDGVIVSNHGGRQVDGGVAALDALPAVVRAVEGKVPVLFDSGIRRGADIFKAVALGARAVLVGRPYAWGLAVAGEQGVRDVLLNLLADFDLTCALSGYAALSEVGLEALVAG